MTDHTSLINYLIHLVSPKGFTCRANEVKIIIQSITRVQFVVNMNYLSEADHDFYNNLPVLSNFSASATLLP